MRVPNPAANTMAVFGTERLIGSRRSGLRVGIDRRWAKRPRQVVLIPDRKRPKQWMGEVAREVTLDPRQVAQILRLMIAFVEAGEQAKNLGGALGSRRGIGGSEALGVEGWIGGRPSAPIEGRETPLDILLHVSHRGPPHPAREKRRRGRGVQPPPPKTRGALCPHAPPNPRASADWANDSRA